MRRVPASHGYADLGLWLDANAELEEIIRDATEVLAVRLRIRAREKWDGIDTRGVHAITHRTLEPILEGL